MRSKSELLRCWISNVYMYKFITKQVAVNIFKIWLPGLAPEPFGKRSSDLNKTENIISISGKQAHLLFLDEVRKTKGLF